MKCEVVCPSNIGKQDPNEVEVDFANKDIGYGPGSYIFVGVFNLILVLRRNSRGNSVRDDSRGMSCSPHLSNSSGEKIETRSSFYFLVLLL